MWTFMKVIAHAVTLVSLSAILLSGIDNAKGKK